MITNLNVRQVSEGGLFVQFQEDGKAKDAVFATWESFSRWLLEKIK